MAAKDFNQLYQTFILRLRETRTDFHRYLYNQINWDNRIIGIFYHQLSCMHEILLAKRGDFMVERKYLFEVGGKHKTFEQISDEPNSFLAIDDIETGMFNRIPLWMFGLLY